MNATYKAAAENAERAVTAAADQLADAAHDGKKAAVKIAEDGMAKVSKTVAEGKKFASESAESVKDAAQDAVDEGRSFLGGALRKAQDSAVEAKDTIVAGAGSTLASVKDVAVAKADEARESLSDAGERLAQTLQRASEQDEDGVWKSRMLGSVAQGLTTASEALRERSVSDLASDVKELARRHPGAFMAAAAVAGFAVARFIRSSSQRRLADQDRGREPRG